MSDHNEHPMPCCGSLLYPSHEKWCKNFNGSVDGVQYVGGEPVKSDSERHLDKVFGKEEKAGPGQIVKPKIQILLEETYAFLQSQRGIKPAMLANQLAGVIGAMGKKRLADAEIFAEWKPTPENIRALPLPIRQHIESCEKLIKENEALREQLTMRIEQLRNLFATRERNPNEAGLNDVFRGFDELKGLVS